MATTQPTGKQIRDGTVQRVDLDTLTTTQAVIAKAVQGSGIALTSTGVDAGTGDVTIAATCTGFANPTAQVGTSAVNGSATTAMRSDAAPAINTATVWKGTAIGDAIYTILTTDRMVYTSVAFTASRAWTLPSAASYGAGRTLMIVDALGTVTVANPIVVTRSGTDLIYAGFVAIGGTATLSLQAARGAFVFVSDGVSRWVLVAAFPIGLNACPTESSNGNATAGALGEYVEGLITAGTPTSITTSNVTQGLTTISLTAGDWDVYGMIGFTPAPTTSISALQGCTSQTNATSMDGYSTFRYGYPSSYVPNITIVGSIPTRRYSLSATTTIFLNMRAIFAVSTITAYGYVSARRVR